MSKYCCETFRHCNLHARDCIHHKNRLLSPEGWIEDLLYCAYKFDDKPHQLYSCIANIARNFEKDPAKRAEIVRLMDEAYEGKR